jgi:hypothetical protein
VKPPACPPPTDSSKSRLCLTFAPQSVTATADPRLDNKGQLIVVAMTDPTNPATTVAEIMYPPPEDDGGLGGEIDISELPAIPLDNMPAHVYVNAYFIDNPEWYAPPISKQGFTYGMYVGGYDLAAGVYPTPTPKPITPDLTAGQGTVHQMSLTALRRFTTTVKYSLVQNMSLIGDGQGPLSVGAFAVSAAKGASVLGGAQLGCKNVTAGDISATGFLYSDSGTDMWLIADLSDFNLPGLAQPGDVLALGGGQDGQSAPDSAKITVTDSYTYSVPAVTLNIVAPYPGTHAADYHCP